MKRLFAVGVFCLVALSSMSAALAREEISRFDADIVVEADGRLDVTETIAVNAEGNEIRRGIFRDIPMRALTPWGFWSDNGFDLVEVTQDGRPATYTTEWQGRFVRIKIGDADVLLSRGEHTYTIRYVTTNQLRFFDSYDEVYWNVTGNFWNFPILDAHATVRLPDGAVAETVDAYTGGEGATGKNFTAGGEGTSKVEFDLTRPLGEQQGLTVAVGFSKGVVAPDDTGLGGLVSANSGILLMIAGWLLLPLYFLYAWNKVGRDPPEQTVIPLFHAPDGLSPAALSYAHFNAFKPARRGSDLAFIAALLSLGVKRMLTIREDDDGDVTLQRGPAVGKRNDLPAGEVALFDGTLGGGQEFRMSKANGQRLLKTQQALRSAIVKEYGGRYYKANIGWFIAGAVLAAVTLIGGMMLQAPPDDGIGTMVLVTVAALAGCALIVSGRQLLASVPPSFLRTIVGGFLTFVGALIFLGGVAPVLLLDGLLIYRLAGALILIGVAVMALMLFLLGAPTAEGAGVLTRIKGFKLYLETAESNRLNLRDAPEMSEELFEKFLPYAAGLAVEEPWSKAWAAHLARVAPGREQNFHPAWYAGNSWNTNNIGAATAASVAAVSAAMASSMPQPKSSSGSSGGGFSGGGGGGGGGGGW
ncbi:putative membrane protein DUF2207 [Hoeflea marina]|uniref:Putative membrane protein DUF2207 n=1 Tax=Hoeflea marina TaxID=274592 RepID=A0A317PPH1_9HYPH|nr:DUF2207 domain-containing protein [Hoeflea marina]PWW01808.1 putative membrane protein DUF2207 [Hoeflea marina]